MMASRTRRGFTLIELLIVVVIIGILAAIAIPKFANTKTKAYQTAMKSDLRNLVTAEEAFFSDSGHYKPYAAMGTQGDTLLHFKPSTGVSDPSIVICAAPRLKRPCRMAMCSASYVPFPSIASQRTSCGAPDASLGLGGSSMASWVAFRSPARRGETNEPAHVP